MQTKPLSAEEPVPRKRQRPKRLRAAALPELSIAQILKWADAHHARTGEWPTYKTGWVHENRNETWHNIDGSLRDGNRGLPISGGLSRLLNEKRDAGFRIRLVRRHRRMVRPLTIEQILAWADAHRTTTGRWPVPKSGLIAGTEGETWMGITNALRAGSRSLPGGSSLARLLAEHRGRRNHLDRPALWVEQILAWADAHLQRTGTWPNFLSGPIEESDGDTWGAINHALVKDARGLRGHSSLARLLEEHRGRRNLKHLPNLTVKQILGWADAHFGRTERWPSCASGEVPEAPGEVWATIDAALKVGRRGLRGGTTLARLLEKHRGKRIIPSLHPLTPDLILDWADDYQARHGRWPGCFDGPVPKSPDDTWRNIDQALRKGLRGLKPGGSSLAQLLALHRGKRNTAALPALTQRQILKWADAHHKREGDWPRLDSGPIPEAPGETWAAVQSALSSGTRGLPGDSSLPQLLAAERGVRNPAALPDLSIPQILSWADHHFQQTGDWPAHLSGAVLSALDETWGALNFSLTGGRRGLPGGISLAQLLSKERGVRNHYDLPALTVNKILGWVDLHRERDGSWPKRDGGPIADAPGETWTGVDVALKKGRRGLPGGSSLPQLLAEHRGVRNIQALPPFRIKEILVWAQAHRERTGQWPTAHSGPIDDTSENWLGVNNALRLGFRGLPGGSSLAKLLQGLEAR